MLSVHSDVELLPLIARKLTTKGKNAEADKRLSIVLGASPRHSGNPVAQWDDAEDQKLEAMLTTIAVEIVLAIEQEYRDAKLRNHRWVLERRAAEIEAARQAKLEAERRGRERLEKLERERVRTTALRRRAASTRTSDPGLRLGGGEPSFQARCTRRGRGRRTMAFMGACAGGPN